MAYGSSGKGAGISIAIGIFIVLAAVGLSFATGGEFNFGFIVPIIVILAISGFVRRIKQQAEASKTGTSGSRPRVTPRPTTTSSTPHIAHRPYRADRPQRPYRAPTTELEFDSPDEDAADEDLALFTEIEDQEEGATTESSVAEEIRRKARERLRERDDNDEGYSDEFYEAMAERRRKRKRETEELVDSIRQRRDAEHGHGSAQPDLPPGHILCLNCGNLFKPGLFSKKCPNCGAEVST
ncbi:MAG: hypothetical protein GF399_01765 [Candidatus Coatesbacteria bacterium]|nr:hypothetical protein [Candidatus Coatesbacteria bacterium]